MERFNNWLAVRITLAVSTMWMFYAFALYGFIPLFFPSAQDKILYWSNYAQLVFLPLIAVGTAVLGKTAEKQQSETHDTVMEQFELIKEELDIAKQERDELKEIHELIKAHL